MWRRQQRDGAAPAAFPGRRGPGRTAAAATGTVRSGPPPAKADRPPRHAPADTHRRPARARPAASPPARCVRARTSRRSDATPMSACAARSATPGSTAPCRGAVHWLRARAPHPAAHRAACARRCGRSRDGRAASGLHRAPSRPRARCRSGSFPCAESGPRGHVSRASRGDRAMTEIDAPRGLDRARNGDYVPSLGTNHVPSGCLTVWVSERALREGASALG